MEHPRSENERSQRRPHPEPAAGLEEMRGVYDEGRGELLELEAAGEGPGDVVVHGPGFAAVLEVGRIPPIPVFEDDEFLQTGRSDEVKELLIV